MGFVKIEDDLLTPRSPLGVDEPMGERTIRPKESVLMPALRTQNMVGSALAAETYPGKYDPETTIHSDLAHDPYELVKGTKYEDYLEEFVGSDSPTETRARMRQIDREMADRQRLADAGWPGFIAEIAAGTVDPTIAMPGGAIAKSAKGGYALLRSMKNIGVAGAAATTVQEAVLQGTQRTRTVEESLGNIGAATILSGLLGGAVARLATKAERAAGVKALDSIKNELRGKPSPEALEEVNRKLLSDEELTGGIWDSIPPELRDVLRSEARLDEEAKKAGREGNEARVKELFDLPLNPRRQEANDALNAALARQASAATGLAASGGSAASDTRTLVPRPMMPAIVTRAYDKSRALLEKAGDIPGVKDVPILGKAVGLAGKGASMVLGIPEWLIKESGPATRMLYSASVAGKRAFADLVENPLQVRENEAGVPTSRNGPAVETTARIAIDGGRWRLQQELDRLYKEYYGGGWLSKTKARIAQARGIDDGRLSFKQWKEQVRDATIAGGKHDDPTVEAASKWLTKEIFEPWKEAAIRVGLLPQDVTVGTAAGYFMRVYDKPKLIAQRQQFIEGAVLPWLKQDQATKASIQADLQTNRDLRAERTKALRKIEKRLETIQRRQDEVEARLSEKDMDARRAGQRVEKLTERQNAARDEIGDLDEVIRDLTDVVKDPELKAELGQLQRELAQLKKADKPVTLEDLEKADKDEEAGILSGPLRKAARIASGQIKAPKLPSFVAWMAKEGGIKDVGGEVLYTVGDKNAVVGLIRPDAKRDLDAWGEKIAQDFPEIFMERLSPDEVIDLIRASNNKEEPSWFLQAMMKPEDLDAYEQAKVIEYAAAEAGVDLKSPSDVAAFLRSDEARTLQDLEDQLGGMGDVTESLGEQVPASDVPNVPNTAVHYKHLGKFEVSDPRKIGLEAAQYVVKEGKASGTEAIIMLDGEGRIIADGTGIAKHVGFPPEVIPLMDKPGSNILVHHNHPSNRSFSQQDLGQLARDGVSVVWAHGNDEVLNYRASLPPALRAVDGDARFKAIWHGYLSAEREVYRLMRPLALAGSITQDVGNKVWNHLVSQSLHNAGLIDYFSNYTAVLPAGSGMADMLRRGTEFAQRTAERYIDAGILAESRRPGRDARTVRHPGDMGIVSPFAGGDAGQRVRSDGADRPRQGVGRAQAGGRPEQLTLFDPGDTPAEKRAKFDAMIAEFKAKNAATQQEVETALNETGAFTGSHADGHSIMVTESLYEPGLYQISTFDKNGEPWGHFNVKKEELGREVNSQLGVHNGNRGPNMLAEPAGDIASPAFKEWFGNSKVVDEKGEPKVLYHGTQRLDRIAARGKFDAKRATSGPMAFFTDDPELASNYAKNKMDTSAADEEHYAERFTIKVRGRPRRIDQAWYDLAPEERARIAELAPRVQLDETARAVIVGPESNKTGIGNYDYEVEQARGNHLKALAESWLMSGAIFGEEERFLDVLKAAGMKTPVEYFDPVAGAPGVVPVYASIKKPLDVANIPPEVADAIRKEAKGKRASSKPGADMWDKRVMDPKMWMARFEESLTNPREAPFTVIPDWVTDTLRRFGYDGIKDTGGKTTGGKAHTVWVPFEETQVKSVHNRGTFDPRNPNILAEPDRSLPGPATDTPEFKRWFGESKVTKDGKPEVVFHNGSFDENADLPAGAMHFGTAGAAQERSSGKALDDALMAVETYQDDAGKWHWDDGQGGTSEDRGASGWDDSDGALLAGRASLSQELDLSTIDDGITTAAYLSIKNPKRMRDLGGANGEWDKAIADAKAQGFDGIVYRNEYEDKGSDSWIAFDAGQIKSVNNRGSFDPSNPNILADPERSLPPFRDPTIPLRIQRESMEETVNVRRENVKAVKDEIDRFKKFRKTAGTKERLEGARKGEAEVNQTAVRGRRGVLQDRSSRLDTARELMTRAKQNVEAELDTLRLAAEEKLLSWEGKTAGDAKAALKRRGEADAERDRIRGLKAEAGIETGEKKRLAGADKSVDAAIKRIIKSERDKSDDELRTLADEIFERIVGSPDGRLPYDLPSGGPKVGPPKEGPPPRGPLAARSFMIPDENIKDWLVSDPEQIAHTYLGSIVPDVLLTERFGDADMTRQFREINEEYAAKDRAATSEKERQEIRKEQERVIGDLAAMRDRIRGTYGFTSDTVMKNAARIAGAAGSINTFADMGGSALSQITDLAGPVYMYGMGTVFRDGWLPFVKNLAEGNKGALGKARRQYNAMGIAIDMHFNTRNLDEVGEQYHPRTKGERALKAGAQGFMNLNLSAPATDMAKTIAAVVSGNEIFRAAKAVAEGKATPKQITNLAASSIDEEMAGRIWKSFQESGGIEDGVYLPNTGDWTDQATRRAFEGAVSREVNIAVVTPGQEKALWLSNPILKILGQFKAFIASSTVRIMAANLQKRDAQTLQGLVTAIALGALGYKAYTVATGQEASDRWQDWAKEGISRSGVMGWLDEGNSLTSKFTRGQLDMYRAIGADRPLSRYASRGVLGAILGPTAGKIENLAQVTGALAAGEFTGADTRAARRLMPLQNLFYIRRLLNDVEEGFNDRMGIPQRKSQ